MLNASDLPDDVAALKAMLIAAQVREAGKDAQIVRKDERIERLEKLVAAFKQAAFGRKSEKTDPDQFNLALEDNHLHLDRNAKLNSVDLQVWLTWGLGRIADHKINRISELLPWSYAAQAA